MQAQLGLILQDVGRSQEGIIHAPRVIAIDPLLPITHGFLARRLSCAGRIQECHAVLKNALARWPAHPMLWNVRYNALLFRGRPGSAAAFVSDPENRPEFLNPSAVEMKTTMARAVAERRSVDIEASVAAYRALALSDQASVPIAAPMLALLGRPDLAFAGLERYFLGAGPFEAQWSMPTRYERRYTTTLFSPPMAKYREDARYKRLIAPVGLENYWKKTGTLPR